MGVLALRVCEGGTLEFLRVLDRLLQLRFQLGYPGSQALHLRPQRDNEGILFLFR